MSTDFILGAVFTYFTMFVGAVIDHFEVKRRLRVMKLEKELKQDD